MEIFEHNSTRSMKNFFIVASTVTAVTLAIGIALLHLMLANAGN